MHDQVEDWSRDGFNGERALIRRPHYAPEYLSVDGPHAPRRLNIGAVGTTDPDGPYALPVAIATAASGLRISVARPHGPMGYVLRNVEADELHFVQSGTLRFRTAYGCLDVEAGDFACIPRAIAYRIEAVAGDALELIVESSGPLRIETSARGVIRDSDIQYAVLDRDVAQGEWTVVVRSHDELTRFVMPHDPLAATERLGGGNPVWKLNIAKIYPLVYASGGGPPAQFLASPGGELLFYTLNARSGGRPPVHLNADFDELIYYFAGPGAWGAVDEPGTFTCVPKGTPHQGPTEDVPDGYLAWLLETRTTLRLTPAGLAVAELMETGMYGRHRDVAGASSQSRR